MITIQRAADRYRTDQPGSTTWHCFSSGAHYDAENIAFGPVVACDEHLVDAGAGFDRHRHARVELVSWVLDGTLRHEDPSGRVVEVQAGAAQHQRAGAGIEHAERNASADAPLHFVQLWLVTDEDVPAYDVSPPPVVLSVGRFVVRHRCRDELLDVPALHLFVAAGRFTAGGYALDVGDSLRVAAESVRVDGDGELLVVELPDLGR